MKAQSIILACTALVIGCGAGASLHVAWAGPTPGKWTCYDINEVPDVDRGKDPKDLHEAQTSKYATSISNLLNQTAADSPVGATQFVGGGSQYGVIGYFCAKN